MTRRDGLWLAAGGLFALVNAAGAGNAVGVSESMHAAIHAGLMVVGVAVAWWIVIKNARRQAPGLQAADDRLERLQQSMDAIAIEVERIGEGQRFSAKLQAERVEERR